MKSKQAADNQYVAIGRIHWDVPVRIPLRPYVEFVGWLDDELEKLVDRWAPTAPPKAIVRHSRHTSRKPR